ncbi:MAG TPA: sugar phosphate nucleotidyltransferase [Anaerolineaceae bacterium]|nr:sugar phosphate nucleotidyltransferase [Anaerolineaceae bacterium]
MKGIILAQQQREDFLFPLAVRTARHLLPVYDKPLIYYPLSTLMLAGIREIMILGSRAGIRQLRACLADGSAWGIQISYQAVPSGTGLAEALLAGAEFTRGCPVALISGENIFHGKDLVDLLRGYAAIQNGAAFFASSVRDACLYPVVELDPDDRPLQLYEPQTPAPITGYAVPGLYFYDAQATDKLTSLRNHTPARISITRLNQIYQQAGNLQASIFGRGMAWLDVQTADSLLQASNFIHVIQERQGVMIACPEEIAYRLGYIDRTSLKRLTKRAQRNAYGQYLQRVLAEE